MSLVNMLKNWLRDIRNSTPKITKRIVFNFGWYFCIILGKIRKFHIFWGFRWEVSPAWASLDAFLGRTRDGTQILKRDESLPPLFGTGFQKYSNFFLSRTVTSSDNFLISKLLCYSSYIYPLSEEVLGWSSCHFSSDLTPTQATHRWIRYERR